MQFSELFLAKVKLNNVPVYKLGLQVGFSPSKIYKILAGIQRVDPNDKRLIKLARLVGVDPIKIFEERGK